MRWAHSLRAFRERSGQSTRSRYLMNCCHAGSSESPADSEQPWTAFASRWSKPVWCDDIDANADAQVLRVVAVKTGTPYKRVVGIRLASYERHLTPPVPRLFDEAERGKWLRFCGTCLKEDAIPYYRREWRLSFVTVCARHGTLLLSGCGNCGRIVDVRQIPLDAIHLRSVLPVAKRSMPEAAASQDLLVAWGS